MKDIPVIFGKKGRTTIPLPLRRRLGWQAGDTIRFRLDGDKVIISRDRPPAQPKAAPNIPTGAVLPLILALLLGGADDG
jgi:AbrB family looped-hinge helix DNA binding protein